MTALPEGTVTNRMVWKLAVDREADTGRCNVDKDALRAWYVAHGD